MGTEIAYAIYAVAALIGAGVSTYSTHQAARSNEQLGVLNAQAQRQAIDQQSRMQQAAAQLEAIRAGKQQDAANANAAAIRAQTDAESRAAQTNIRRGRGDFDAALAVPRAAIARRGIVDTTGSPLDLLVKAARDEQLYEEEQRHADEINRRVGMHSAAVEEMQGQVAGLDIGMSLLRGAAARTNALMQRSQTNLDLFSTRANSAAMRNQAIATGISGLGSIGMNTYNFRRTSTPAPYASGYRSDGTPIAQVV
jgi:hypothetical protein